MNYALAGLALLAAITLANALLTAAVVKRWRAAVTASAHAAHASAAPAGPPELAVQEGDPVPEFTLHTPQGEVTAQDLSGHTALLCFLRPDCGPTRESLPAVRRWAETHAPAGARVVAIVNGAPEAAGPLLEAVAPCTELTTVEAPDGPLARTFGVRHHPSFVLLDADGTVTETGIGNGSLTALDLATV
ncbi:TlpA family protein disulfide reductase [Streptomyces sp. TRM66268-LWL]|uniref:TlpA family protein disulfide reductase n=1 Tax=Streptomyces polyasparticus TaxID=2767826 RepID=A0ABR7S684_9ACTN|nr:TlpA disulfide reductase family protein [Streptomyces polyasparticus]MBC9711001.1 TlpA family protein disulfide reductase [Streptomyces polyasparticus]